MCPILRRGGGGGKTCNSERKSFQQSNEVWFFKPLKKQYIFATRRKRERLSSHSQVKTRNKPSFGRGRVKKESEIILLMQNCEMQFYCRTYKQMESEGGGVLTEHSDTPNVGGLSDSKIWWGNSSDSVRIKC